MNIPKTLDQGFHLWDDEAGEGQEAGPVQLMVVLEGLKELEDRAVEEEVPELHLEHLGYSQRLEVLLEEEEVDQHQFQLVLMLEEEKFWPPGRQQPGRYHETF